MWLQWSPEAFRKLGLSGSASKITAAARADTEQLSVVGTI